MLNHKRPTKSNIHFSEFEKLLLEGLFIVIVATFVITIIILIFAVKRRNMSEADEKCVIRARLPIPVFNSINIELWFIQLENWFLFNQIKMPINLVL